MARVLVVDDHPGVARAVAQMAGMSGCEVAVVDGGEAALEFLRTRRVDLVILDVSMPRVSGFDVLREMAADGMLAATKVVMFSAGHEHREKALRLGAVAFVVKDEADELTAEIEKHVRCGAPADDPPRGFLGPAV